jgi:PKD repeat protein
VIKCIILIAYLIISFPAYATSVVLYINGASANATWPEKQAKAFYEKIKLNNISGGLTPELLYYPIPQSEIGSATGILCQREISEESFPTKGIKPSPEELNQYYKTLGRMYDDMWLTALKNPSCNGTLPGIANMYNYVLGLSRTLKKLIDEKKKVTIVSYSMGNNYAEAAIAYMYHKGQIETVYDINIVGIGAPTFTLPGDYINASLDSVVYYTLNKPYSLPPTINYCIDPCTSIATYQDLLDNGGISGHILIEDYLNDKFFAWEEKKKVSSVIADKIKNTLSIPSPTVSFSGSPTSIKINDVVTFTPTATSSNGAVTTYNWSFGDGEMSQSTVGSAVQHVYTTPGTYTVQLTVTDVAGKTNLSTQTVTVAAIDTVASDFEDTFVGTSFSSDYWTARGGTQCGGSQVSGGYAKFYGGTNADTQGKRVFSGSKIVVEAVMAGTQANRDTHFELIDTVSGDVIQIGDTSYGGYGLYIAAAGQYAISQQGLSPTTSSFKSYRLSVQGKFVTIQRGDSFENMEGATYEMGASIAGRSFYLRIGTGASDCVYSPGTFDMVRVITTQNLETSWKTVWFTVADNFVPIRLNSDGIIQCASSDGANCFWGNTAENMPAATNPITCNAEYEAISQHWCAQMKEVLSMQWITRPQSSKEYAVGSCGNWRECESKAKILNAHLVAINDPSEDAWLSNAFSMNTNYWIGATNDGVIGQWRWTTGESFNYTNWGQNLNNNGGNEFCAHYYNVTPGIWNDLACNSTNIKGLFERSTN